MAMQVVAGLEYLHHQNVLHCDLAARNVLVSFEGQLKICACREQPCPPCCRISFNSSIPTSYILSPTHLQPTLASPGTPTHLRATSHSASFRWPSGMTRACVRPEHTCNRMRHVPLTHSSLPQVVRPRSAPQSPPDQSHRHLASCPTPPSLLPPPPPSRRPLTAPLCNPAGALASSFSRS